jgi:hypothetical protein
LEEDEFDVDFLLATSKAGADIDKTEEPLGFMLQGRSLIHKPVHEEERPVKAERSNRPVKSISAGVSNGFNDQWQGSQRRFRVEGGSVEAKV